MSNLTPLTHLESRVLAAIDRHIQHNGQSPTIAELALALRLKSKGTVHRYVQSLIEKKRLERYSSGWRGLRLAGALPKSATDQPNGASDAANVVANIDSTGLKSAAIDNVIDLVKLPSARISSGDFRLPLLGRIAAGQPIEAIEDENQLDLAEFFIGPDRYALRVTGNSMMDVGILDGDTVILRKTSKARSGDIVVALIDSQEATLKRLGEFADGMVELIPENKTMKTMRYSAERVSFQGVLVGQLRSY